MLPLPECGPHAGIGRDQIPGEPIRSKIIAGLIQCRHDGFLQGVWVDADVIRVRYPGDFIGAPERMTWSAAALFVSGSRKMRDGAGGAFRP